MLQVWWWTPWTCLNWRRHHDVKFALSQLPSSCFGIPTCCSCDCSCTCNCRGLILHPGLFKMLLLNIQKVPAQHIRLRLLGLQFCFLYGMQPTRCCLTLGCAETKQFCLMYHTWSTFVCLEVTMLQIWRWTPWTCLNWRRHHDVKFALSQLPSSCFGIPTCCSCDYIMIPIVVDELCIRAPSKCSCWISTGCQLSICC